MRRPRYPGIDLEAALLTVGDAELLDELIVELVSSWHDGASRIERALAAEAPHEGADVAHALAGVAAVLSARRIAAVAHSIEAALRGDERRSLPAQLAELWSALAELVLAVNGPNDGRHAPQRETVLDAVSTTNR